MDIGVIELKREGYTWSELEALAEDRDVYFVYYADTPSFMKERGINSDGYRIRPLKDRIKRPFNSELVENRFLMDINTGRVRLLRIKW